MHEAICEQDSRREWFWMAAVPLLVFWVCLRKLQVEAGPETEG